MRITPTTSAKAATSSALTDKQNFTRRFGAIGEFQTIADALLCFPSLDVIGIVASYAVFATAAPALTTRSVANWRTAGRTRLSKAGVGVLTARRTAGVRTVWRAGLRSRWPFSEGNRGQPRRSDVANRHRVCSRRRQRVRQLPRAALGVRSRSRFRRGFFDKQQQQQLHLHGQDRGYVVGQSRRPGGARTASVHCRYQKSLH